MRDKERDGHRADGQSNWRKEEETESERTKCNLSAYSDSQCLKWELTESVEDCSLIGQGHSWHFQAKLQWQWWERMCYNYKLFPLPLPPFRAASEPQRLFFLSFTHVCIIFHLKLSCPCSQHRPKRPFRVQGWTETPTCIFVNLSHFLSDSAIPPRWVISKINENSCLNYEAREVSFLKRDF